MPLKGLSAHYKLGDDIVLTGKWTPIGTFDAEEDGETPKAEAAFTGTFDGDGYTIFGLTVKGDFTAGLFGCVANGTVKNVTVKDATVSGGCMVAAVVGYAYDSTVENITLTTSKDGPNTITCNQFYYGKDLAAPNMMAGIVGAGMDSTVTGCMVENTELSAIGFENADGWGTNVHDIGLLGGGLENTSLIDCKVQNSAIEITGPSAYGIGGLSGCAMVAEKVEDCSVSDVTITMKNNANLVGGLVGYTGKTDGEVTTLTGCTTTGVSITVGDASYRIGGLIGGGFYLPGYESYFPVPTSYSVTDATVSGIAITTGTNSAALGLVAGQGYLSSITVAKDSGKINGSDSATICGAPEDENSTFLYDLSTTYQPLFVGATFESKYDHYWKDYAAAVVGEATANKVHAADMMKTSIGASWKDKDEGDSFCCEFTNNIANLTFQGSVITGYDADDNVVFSHAYKYLRDGHLYGPDPDDSTKQIPYMDLTIYESLDDNTDTDEFRYFAMCGDTPGTTYHIEFRYGSDLEALEQMYTGIYGHWLAAGIPTAADETMYSNVIALFCAENLSSMTTEGTETQRAPLVGTWLPADTSEDLLVFAADGTVNGSEGSVFYAYNGSLITVLDDVCTGYRYTLEGDTLTLKTADEKTVLGTYTKWDGYYDVTIRENITGGTVTSAFNEAQPGDTVTFTATPADDSYTTTSVGYWTISRDGKAGKLNTLKANEDGTYSFTMSDSAVVIGAAFQQVPFLSGGSSSRSGQIGGTKETDWYLYASNEHAYLPTENAQPTARLFVDERFLDQEDMTLTLETREYSSGGYKVVGTKTYTHDEVLKLFSESDATEGTTTYNKQTVTYKRLDSAGFPAVVSLTNGNKVYLVAKFGREAWVDAKGDATYRWTPTEDSTVTTDVSEAPQPIVWLYNLTADSHRGAIVRGILDQLGIEIGTIDGSTLDENIGYLVGWEGYESTDPVYNTNTYDVEYILMGNLTETQMDDFLDGMSKQNIRVNLKSVPTAWTASKTFSELFAIMAEEDDAFKAILALDSMIYDAEQLDEKTYSDREGWDDFQKALKAAQDILGSDKELDAQAYLDASEALKQAYLKVTNKTALTGDLALTLTKQENGNYQISAKLENGPADAQFSYAWQNGATGATLENWSADALRQVKLTITGTNGFYGTLSATLSVPSGLTYRTSATTDSITVKVDAVPQTRNMPAPTGYVVQLYQGDTLIGEQKDVNAGSVLFSGLSRDTRYTVKLYATNVVGRSDILTADVKTSSGSSSGGGSGSSAKTYAVTTPAVENGSVSVSTKSAAQGSTVMVTVMPDSGYALDRLTVTDAKGAAVAVTALGDDKYTFTMPAAQVTVQASFALSAPATVGGFTDVAANAYYADAVAWAVEQGVTSGMTATTFAPNADCTRAQMVTFLWRAVGSPKAESSTTSFTDVDTGAYYYDAVLWAVEKGITTGTTATTFDPDAVVSRGQTVTFLYRAAGAPDVTGNGTFTDIPAAAYYADAVAWAVEKGITNGTTATTFDPNGACTRAQIVTFLYRNDQAK